ncbi:hypothetical protein DVH24_019861 [Malus domestica]|uniref:F-box domain-containing protein n=1 Tax=Malus domestica TaxID=3750 RepID=A0A498I798_MALDO|nr:hypothetical protein DVH24_019861 [Malus domestica]
MRMSSWLKKQLLANCVSRLNFLRLHVGEKHNSITLSLKRMEEYGSTCNWTIWTLCNFGFSGSRFHEVLMYVSLVCRSWNAACCNPIHWKKLNLTAQSALRFSCGNLSSLVFHFSLFINYDHLIMLRTPGLKQLLCSFKFNAVRERGVVAYTPKLKVRIKALICILSEMQYLEVVNVSHCTFLEDSEYSGYSYICEQLGESIIAQASQLKEFLVCPGQLCDKC